MNSEMQDDVWDRAVADRLAKLRSVPVDTSHLERSVRAVIPAATGPRRLSLTRPLRGRWSPASCWRRASSWRSC